MRSIGRHNRGAESALIAAGNEHIQCQVVRRGFDRHCARRALKIPHRGRTQTPPFVSGEHVLSMRRSRERESSRCEAAARRTDGGRKPREREREQRFCGSRVQALRSRFGAPISSRASCAVCRSRGARAHTPPRSPPHHLSLPRRIPHSSSDSGSSSLGKLRASPTRTYGAISSRLSYTISSIALAARERERERR